MHEINSCFLPCFDRINKWEDLDELSSTDLEQQWGKMKAGVKADFDAIPLSQYCHVNKEKVPIYSRSVPDVCDELASNFAKILINGKLPRSD